MKFFLKLLLLTIVLFASYQKIGTSIKPQKEVKFAQTSQFLDNQIAPIVRVIDGDTVEVLINDKQEKVRVIGVNAPESVDPRKGVECFGREASERAKSLLLNKKVHLESDPTQADRDKYGRLLRYVFMQDGIDFGLTMIKEGYAYEYTYDVPYKYQKEYQKAQKDAEDFKFGLWADGACKN